MNMNESLLKPVRIALVVFSFVIFAGCQQNKSLNELSQNTGHVEASQTPLQVVNERMSAYNDHDIEAFMQTYGESIEISTYSGKSLGKGKKHIQSIFAPMFQEGEVQVEIHHQIAKDGYVVNHETVSDRDKTTEYVSIYEVRDGLIQSVCFIRD